MQLYGVVRELVVVFVRFLKSLITWFAVVLVMLAQGRWISFGTSVALYGLFLSGLVLMLHTEHG